MPIPRKLASRMKFEMREEPDVGGHPADKSDLDEQDYKGRQEDYKFRGKRFEVQQVPGSGSPGSALPDSGPRIPEPLNPT